LCSCRLEEGLELLVHPSLLGGGRLGAAMQEHGCGCKVLRRVLEERRVAAVNDGILVDAPVHVVRTRASRWCPITGY
jgi:hypothetical protein